MGLSLALTASLSVLALVVGTCFSYFGDGCYCHRKRLEFLPKIWSLTWFTGAYFGCAIMEEHSTVIYFFSLFAALIGWGIGCVILDGIWIPATERLRKQVEARYTTAQS